MLRRLPVLNFQTGRCGKFVSLRSGFALHHIPLSSCLGQTASGTLAVPDLINLPTAHPNQQPHKSHQEHYLSMQLATDESWDYTLYDKDFKEIDGGQIGDGSISFADARNDILEAVPDLINLPTAHPNQQPHKSHPFVPY